MSRMEIGRVDGDIYTIEWLSNQQKRDELKTLAEIRYKIYLARRPGSDYHCEPDDDDYTSDHVVLRRNGQIVAGCRLSVVSHDQSLPIEKSGVNLRDVLPEWQAPGAIKAEMGKAFSDGTQVQLRQTSFLYGEGYSEMERRELDTYVCVGPRENLRLYNRVARNFNWKVEAGQHADTLKLGQKYKVDLMLGIARKRSAQ